MNISTMAPSPYSKESLRVGILHFLLGRGVAGLAGFFTVILLVRYMDVQSYAGYTALSGIIVLAGIVASLGLERAISRYIPEGRLERSASELSQFIWQISLIRLMAALIMSLVIYASWHLLPLIFHDVTIQEFPIALGCFILAETLFQHFSSILQALVLQKTLTRIMVIQWAGRLFLIFYIIWQHESISLESSLWVMAIPEMLGVIAFVIVLRHYLHQLKLDQLDNAQNSKQLQNDTTPIGASLWPDWQGLLKMSLNNYGFTLIAAPPQGYFMKMLIAAFLPTQMVAAYGFFISVAERLRQYIPLHLLYNLIEPVMIANYLQDKNFKLLSDRSKLLYKSNLLLLIPVIAWVVVAGQDIISLLTAGKYQDYAWLLALVLLQLTIGSHVVLLQLILNSVNASRVLVRAGSWALVMMVIAALLATQVDLRALVLGPVVFSFTCNFYVLYQLKQMQLDYAFTWGMLSGVVSAGTLAAILTYVGLVAIKPLALHALWIAVLSGISVLSLYSSCLLAFKVIHQSEIDLVKSLFVKKSVTGTHAISQ